MIEPTEKVGLGSDNLGEGGQLEVPQIKDEKRVWLGEFHHCFDIFVVGHVPGNQGKMLKGLTLVVPHQLNLRACFTATAPGPGKFGGQTRRQAKARAVRDVDPPKRGKESVLTHAAC